MITKMTKYSFVLLSGEKEGFLEQLQELGVVDISRSVKPVDHDSNEMFEQADRTRKVIEYLESIDYTSDADAAAIAKTTVEITGDPVDFTEDCRTKLSELGSALALAEKQMKASAEPSSLSFVLQSSVKSTGSPVISTVVLAIAAASASEV